MKSRPYKFKSQERKGKPRTFDKGDRFEPMTDAELAAALNIHVKEVEEFFEKNYYDIPDPQVYVDTFDDDDYNLDIDGLKLGEISTLSGNENISKSLENLMAVHGYDVDGNVVDHASYDGDKDTVSSADLDGSIQDDISKSLKS